MGFHANDPLDPDQRARWPWEDAERARATVFVALGATGADPAVDGIFRLSALRRGADGAWERFDRLCDPFPGEREPAATQRMVREFGVNGADLAGAPPAGELAAEFLAFLGEGPVVAADGAGCAAWLAHLAGGADSPRVLGLGEGAALLRPGSEAPRPRADGGPEAVREALAGVVGAFLELDEGVREFALCALAGTWQRLEAEEPELAAELCDWLALVEHPLSWSRDPASLFAAHPALADGRAAAALAAAHARGGDPAEHARDLIASLEPRCAVVGRLWDGFEAVAVHAKGELALCADDLRRVDEVFEVHLPALAGEEATLHYRAGQHQVAREVARTLGANELLLVSAPTGTGKTLAYLVPAALWALRNGVRVGLSTYTRTLQEQAATREVPRALEALARAGLEDRPRVTLLKGRANYLCWRTLLAQAPDEDDGGGPWLAWTLLALFALCDEYGDLDRLAQRAPLGGRSLLDHARSGPAARVQRELETAVRGVRAQIDCCTRSPEREACAAQVARARAERSHLVLINHAFALARQGFLKHVIFDECEHLHEQAHSAFSYTLTARGIGESLARLRQGGRGGRALFDRLERAVPDGRRLLAGADQALREARAGLDALEGALAGFRAWREEQRGAREERDEHALFREFVERRGEIELAPPLIAARVGLESSLSCLDSALSGLAADTEVLPGRGLPRLRRALELARGDLLGQLASLKAWLPMMDGEPALRAETFHDVEEDPRGRDVLAARVLLPNEYLGRYYYPQLQSAVLLSATTWLSGGFESAMGYLGLDRAAAPAPDEDREPVAVRSFRAPEVFDYARVLVGVPKDAPEPRQKEVWLAFVRRFVAHLGERTRGRMLVLFTNAEELKRAGEGLAGHFRARHIPLWWQGMPGVAKEELPRLFRARKDSVLMGLDTFWFGADFPGETLEYLVIARLPYGVPDRYHHAQCAALGAGEQRRRIYMPRALAKLRQGFGRLMRRVDDRGCVFLLDRRVIDPRHRAFLREMPLAEGGEGGARLVVAPADEVVRAGLAHMGMLADLRRRGLESGFDAPAAGVREEVPDWELPRRALEPEVLDIPPGDVPF